MVLRESGTVFLIPGFPADEQDTSCVPAVQNYVAAYAARHPERSVHVVAFQYPFVRGRYRWKGVTVHALAGRNGRGGRRLATWGRAFRCVPGIARRARIEVLHSFWLGECAWVGQGLAGLLRARHVASIGGQDACAENPYLPWLRLRGMTITAGSSFAAGVFQAHTGRTVDAVVPLGLDASFLRGTAGGIPGMPGMARDVDVLGVGSLIPLKRYDVFVALVARLIPEHPELRAVIVGDGPERAGLEARIADAGLEHHVRLAGHLPRDEVRRLMLRSRVLLHPSRYEGQGYVFLEALASGLFVVCREVGYTAGHPAAFRCASDAALLEGLKAALSAAPPPPGRVPSVDDTVAAFDAFYREP